jgi:hypothetical protein
VTSSAAFSSGSMANATVFDTLLGAPHVVGVLPE